MAQYTSISWLAGAKSAAYYAALSLIVIQVGIGVIMKASQTGGQYMFSASASVTISEFLKFLLSGLFYWRECQRRQISFHSTPTDVESGSSTRTSSSSLELEHHDLECDEKPRKYTRLDSRTFWKLCKNELSSGTRYGFAQLALLYALINNSIFVAYKLADPGTISLTRSGVTFITALVMICAVSGTRISKIQWVAILIQICGLIISQYRAEVGISYPITTYLVLIFQVFLTAIAGVYNHSLLKGEDASLHVGNMMMYGSGVFINLLLHITMKILKDDEPSFFSGYSNVAAIFVVISNVFIGLAITAVYKYADAVIKCLATAVATGILLYISPILFGTERNPLVLPGAIIVLVSSWLYVESALPKEAQETNERTTSGKGSVSGTFALIVKNHRKISLVVATLVTVIIVAFLELSKSELPDIHPIDNEILSTPDIGLAKPDSAEIKKMFIESPFKNTLGVVRWNSEHPERMPTLRKYAPFFHDLHFSMPNYIKDPNLSPTYHNLTHDSYENAHTIYMQLSRTMQLLLDAPEGSPESEIDGILYFHFDAWFNPLQFAHEEFRNIWMPHSVDINGGGPTFVCMTDATRAQKYPTWFPLFPSHRWQDRILDALAVLNNFDIGYVFDPQEYCTGWSDFYYIPKRYFADYIFLSQFFGNFEAFHEIAIPTMMHIIDQTRRPHIHQTILSRPGDCWGGCCHEFANLDAVMTHRCGHKIGYIGNLDIVDAHFGRLEEEAAMLGTPVRQSSWSSRQGMQASDDRKKLFKSPFEAKTKTVLQAIADDVSKTKGDDNSLPESPDINVVVSEQEVNDVTVEMEGIADTLLSNLEKGGSKPEQEDVNREKDRVDGKDNDVDEVVEDGDMVASSGVDDVTN